MRLPTKDEINVHESLDEISACEHFLNKTLEEAEAADRTVTPFLSNIGRDILGAGASTCAPLEIL